MNNKALDDIKKFAITRLQQEYGYCGVAESTEVAMLISGGDDENITVHLNFETTVSG